MCAEIIEDNSGFVIALKPEGVNIHFQDQQEGFVFLLSQHLGMALFPVHRLDKETSGLLLLAKSSQAASELSQQFAEGKVKKQYLALTSKKPKKKMGWVKGDMEKARNGSWKLTQGQENPASTYFESKGLGDGKRLFFLQPHTGKTHQLRVALKSLGSPILGDKRYGGEAADRMYLHAYSLGFNFQGRAHFFQCAPQSGDLFLSDLFQQQINPVD